MRVLWLLVLVVMMAACSPSQAQTAIPLLTPTPTPTPTDRYEVKAWVDKTHPQPGQVVGLTGSLIKNGVYLNGIMMSGYWQQPGEASPSQHCYDMSTYQRGKCIVIVEGFPEDVFVPLQIEFIYNGLTYIADTGFTPQGK
jgi:hypothetical protein